MSEGVSEGASEGSEGVRECDCSKKTPSSEF